MDRCLANNETLEGTFGALKAKVDRDAVYVGLRAAIRRTQQEQLDLVE